MSDLIEKDLTCEVYREYDFKDALDCSRVYRITAPKTLAFRLGGTTHRIVDSEGVVHCVPAPGNCGCVLRWLNKDSNSPVAF